MSDMISGPRRPVGVRDVAAAAGVSRQTVSRVLNEHPDVAEATKERVLAAMSDLGYRMNNAARALGTKRTRTIGVVASDALEYGPSRSIAAIEASARVAGFWVSAAFADSGDADSVRSAVAHLQAQAVDGLIVFAPHASALDVLDGIDVGVPVAVLHAGGRGESGLSVDQVTGARLAVRALVDAGHRRIAHVAGPAEWMEASARTAGVVAELDAHGLRPVVIVDGDWTAGSGHRAAAAVAESGATAVFVSNDQMALGLIGGLRERGLRVPEDVSVVGFDDTPDAAFFWPALTTVRQDFEELARRAVAAVTGEGLVPSEPVEPVLIERASVQPPRHADGIAR